MPTKTTMKRLWRPRRRSGAGGPCVGGGRGRRRAGGGGPARPWPPPGAPARPGGGRRGGGGVAPPWVWLWWWWLGVGVLGLRRGRASLAAGARSVCMIVCKGPKLNSTRACVGLDQLHNTMTYIYKERARTRTMIAAMRLRMAPKRAIFHCSRSWPSAAASASICRRCCCDSASPRMARRFART